MSNHSEIFETVRVELIDNQFRLDVIAFYAEVSRQTLRRWINDPPRTPRLDTVTRVANELGLEITVRRQGNHLRVVG